MTTNNPQQAFYSLLIKCLDHNNEERKNAEMQITKISERENVFINTSIICSKWLGTTITKPNIYNTFNYYKVACSKL